MGYVAVTGGQEAIQASIQLLKEYRSKGERPVDLQVLRDRMGLLIDRIMSEAGLYAPDYCPGDGEPAGRHRGDFCRLPGQDGAVFEKEPGPALPHRLPYSL